jgi:hypothetical protein
MYVFIYLFGKRLSFKDLNILNDDTTVTKLGKKKKKTLETTCCCCWDLGQYTNFTYLSIKRGKSKF